MIELLMLSIPIFFLIIMISKKLYNLSKEIQKITQEKIDLITEYDIKIREIEEELKINKDFNMSMVDKEISKKNHIIATLKKDRYYLKEKLDKISNTHKKFTEMESELYIFHNNLNDKRYEGEEWLITDLKQKAEMMNINLLHHYNTNNRTLLARYLSLYEDYQSLKVLLFKYFDLK